MFNIECNKLFSYFLSFFSSTTFPDFFMILLQVQGVQAGPGYPWWLLALHYIWQFGVLSFVAYWIYRALRYAFKHSGWFPKKREHPPTANLLLIMICIGVLTACQQQEPETSSKVEQLQKDFHLEKSNVPPSNVLTFNTVEEARQFLILLENNKVLDPTYQNLLTEALPEEAHTEAAKASARVDNSNPNSNNDDPTTNDGTYGGLPGFPGRGTLPGIPTGPRQSGVVTVTFQVSLANSIIFSFTYDKGVIKDTKVSLGGVPVGPIVSLNSWSQTRYYKSSNSYVVEVVCDQGIGIAIKDLDIINVYHYVVKYTIVVSPDKAAATVYINMLSSTNPTTKLGPVNTGSGGGGGGSGTIPGGSTPGGNAGSGGIPTWVYLPPPAETAEQPLDDRPQGAQPSYARVANK